MLLPSVLSDVPNHTDAFMYNDASSESTTEGGALGQVYIDFGGSVFSSETNNHLSLYDGGLNITFTDGDYAEFTFEGTGIGFMTERYNDLGEVEVYVDGVLEATVDCYNDPDGQSQSLVFTKLGMEYGKHTIKVVKKSGQYMLVDAFAVWTGETPELEPVELDTTSVPPSQRE